MESFQLFEESIVNRAHLLADTNPIVFSLAKFASQTGDMFHPIVMMGILTLWLSFGTEEWMKWVAPVLGRLLVCSAATNLLRILISRPRPTVREQVFGKVPSKLEFIVRSSFPSGHASKAFFLATTVHLSSPTRSVYLYIWALAVGISRVFKGRHYPSDVLTGACLGSGMAWLLTGFVN